MVAQSVTTNIQVDYIKNKFDIEVMRWQVNPMKGTYITKRKETF